MLIKCPPGCEAFLPFFFSEKLANLDVLHCTSFLFLPQVASSSPSQPPLPVNRQLQAPFKEMLSVSAENINRVNLAVSVMSAAASKKQEQQGVEKVIMTNVTGCCECCSFSTPQKSDQFYEFAYELEKCFNSCITEYSLLCVTSIISPCVAAYA